MSENTNTNPDVIRFEELAEDMPDTPRHELRRVAIKCVREIEQRSGTNVILAD